MTSLGWFNGFGVCMKDSYEWLGVSMFASAVWLKPLVVRILIFMMGPRVVLQRLQIEISSAALLVPSASTDHLTGREKITYHYLRS